MFIITQLLFSEGHSGANERLLYLSKDTARVAAGNYNPNKPNKTNKPQKKKLKTLY